MKNEYVIEIKGKVVARSEKEINPDLFTGKVEVHVNDAKILSKSKQNFE